jgi:hypothetical protein
MFYLIDLFFGFKSEDGYDYDDLVYMFDDISELERFLEWFEEND